MQFQSPVALRLFPTLPARDQLHGPSASGSQTDRAGGAVVKAKTGRSGDKSNGSKTHRVMASTNATSLAAVKQVRGGCRGGGGGGVVGILMMMMTS